MENPLALIDLDGTLANFGARLESSLRTLASPQEIVDGSYINEKLPHIEKRTLIIKQHPGFWKGLEPIKSGFDVVKLLRDLEFTLMILTKGPVRTTSAWTEKVEWCAEHIPDAQVTVTHDKKYVYGRVLFDDWPDYVLPWLANRPRGFVIMLEQPWNEGFAHPQVFKYKDFDPSNPTEYKEQYKKLRELLIEARDR